MYGLQRAYIQRDIRDRSATYTTVLPSSLKTHRPLTFRALSLALCLHCLSLSLSETLRARRWFFQNTRSLTHMYIYIIYISTHTSVFAYALRLSSPRRYILRAHTIQAAAAAAAAISLSFYVLYAYELSGECAIFDGPTAVGLSLPLSRSVDGGVYIAKYIAI